MPIKVPPILLLLPLVAAVSGSRAAPLEQAAAPPPARLAAHETWITGGQGFAFRVAYFTAAELADSRWEAGWLASMKQVRVCQGGERIVRRDIRWYEPMPLSERRCAAVVYTVQCTIHGPIPGNRLDADRIELLRLDPEPPIRSHCNEQDPARNPPTAVELAQRMDHPTMDEIISPTATCATGKGMSAEPIRMVPDTRIQVRTFITPGFASAVPFRSDWYPRIPASQIEHAFGQAGRVRPRMRVSSMADDGSNILISQEFGLDAAGHPYCVRLTARQGPRRWEMRIQRPGLVEQLRAEVGIDRFGHSNDPRRYWHPGGDATSLAEALSDYLLRHAAPDAEFRRGWEGAKPSVR